MAQSPNSMVQFARWKVVVVLILCTLGVLYALPNVLGRDARDWLDRNLPDWMPSKTVNLGLDLQGGAHLLLEVDLESVIAGRLESIEDALRRELNAARIGYTGLGVQGQSVTFSVRDPARLDEAVRIARGLEADIVVQTNPDGSVAVAFTDAAMTQQRQAAVAQSIEVIRRRIDETGTREPNIIQSGQDRIIVELPGVEDPERVKNLIGQTAKLSFQLVDVNTTIEDARAGRLPPGTQLLPAAEREPGFPEAYVVQRRALVTGENLVDAQLSFDPQTNEPVVNFQFDTVGARRFGEVTQENVGRPFAIVLDNEVISAPRINEPILGGRGVISGNFTVQSAQDLALLLRAGALPAPLEILEERTVGPGLGQDSIKAGSISSIAGLVLVVMVMIVTYSRFGVMASVALGVNIILIFAALSALGAALSLPGIAGIILTIGMAVDANVLIFERIREEQAAGRGPVMAIDAGYRRAFGTILDSNLTTLIAGLLLYLLGSGPIRGFAVTLTIGILTSLFTSIAVTRLMVLSWLKRRRPKVVPL